jgi:acyl-CoA synthetase (AMP-forming)/AMP-acid ligase II
MKTFAGEFLRHSTETPDRIGVVLQHAGADDVSITYRDLMRGAARYALALENAGIQPGDVVIVILQHGRELIDAYWGAILRGAIPSIMPYLTEKLAPERYRADLATLVSITKPSALITYPEFESEVRAFVIGGSSVRSVLVTAQLPAEIEAVPDHFPGLDRSPEDIVLLQHSSGTTGLQKGVALSHRAIFNQLDAYGTAIRLTRDDVIVSWLPLYHDMGLIACFLMPILRGVPLVLMSPFDWVRAPYRLMQAVSQYRGTLTWMPNFAFNFCAQKIRERYMEGVDLSSWRAIINCSEPVRAESHVAFAEKFKSFGLNPLALQTSYAMAENVFGVTQSDLDTAPVVEDIDRDSYITERIARDPIEGKSSMKMMSSGKAVSNTMIRIVDEQGNDLPDRIMGEIALQSNCMLTEYYNRPDATASALRDGWYVTGDYGYRSDGEIFVSGRKKDMIIVGGKNVYPQDVEALVGEVPGVHAGRTVAFGIYDDESGTEEVVIVAESDLESEQERIALEDRIRQHVTKSSAITVRHVRVVGAKWVLKTSSGKTARSANREKYVSELKNGERSDSL